jgi:hypothetical protein
MDKSELTGLIEQAIIEAVKANPELLEQLRDPALKIVIEDELRAWEQACYKKGTAYVGNIPDGLAQMVNDMLGYTKSKEDVNTVFDDVIAFLKNQPVPASWHRKIPKWEGEPLVFIEDWEITDEDIDRAIDTWDKTMPDYNGLLDAEVEE